MMKEQESAKKLGPLLQRMAELNSEANALSAEIDQHLRGRAEDAWPVNPSVSVEDEEATA
jgi:hypothetical protein